MMVMAKASELLAVAREFWKLQQQLTKSGAVKWVEFDSGELLVFTRGEYRDQILENIAPLGSTHFFSDLQKESDEQHDTFVG
jgi:hypothetical protein